ncbi:protein of unknown function DUF1549 [Chthoniobacter flavus Ellin428]|uniref:Cytochrome c domain-containing protein n=1 Tax=Chthoniobacter flavus Ellin428 TaxID=497964 RepID=B4D0C1_9BACT|nr:PSD1 and planctomycete cytochrome C domain-containing protein [Chthoniobacter flavus]EDY20435.1 protein of unknown function DUF1549 [Chthoniobacter flavus Ellin428]TCO83204.1 cytochrome c [Chthoniobacter flavus]
MRFPPSISAFLLATVAVPASLSAAGKVDFDRDIRPILAENCTNCHGPDERDRKGKLRFDVRDDALQEHEGGIPIVPGKPEKSELIERVYSTDKDDVMPPPKSNKTLKAEQKDLLKRWIAEGAEYRMHWSFEPVKASPVPELAKPIAGAVDLQEWAGNPIDHFILARLNAEGIAPSPEADRRTLARRLSLDLLGLPPTPDEVEAFVSDAAPDAYERLVDRLLASPHFGERWGRHWLDLARYADSDGYEKDLARPYAYLFRDWVIAAFNRDLPFDEFTIEQIAGDLLPDATEQQKIATGFHRQTLTNREGGVDKEEFRCKATVDRASTTGEVWLGLTLGCAECHSHKFDPISHKEFYQFYSFFNNASERDIPEPTQEELATHQAAMDGWQKKHTELEQPLQAYLGKITSDTLAEWEATLLVPAEHWTVLPPTRLAAIMEGAEEQFTAQKDGSIIARSRDSVRTRYRIAVAPPRGTTGFRLEALADPGKNVGSGKDAAFGLSEFYATIELRGGETKRVNFVHAAVDFADDPKGAEHIIDNDRTTHWTVKKQPKSSHVAVFTLPEPLDLPEGARFELHAEFFTEGVMSHFRIAATTDAGPFTPDLTPDEILAIVRTPGEKRTVAQWKALTHYYAVVADDEGRELNAAVLAHDAQKPVLKPTMALVMAADRRSTHIHIRGDFLQKGDEVQSGTPAFLPPLQPRGATADRLDLARWLVSSANPLTPRVRVNHIWLHLFGRGLVATENDFGTRGEKPSHPELLDWLAEDFRSHGWSQKRLIKEIVTSAAYRQSSNWRTDLAQRDPLNVLLARQGRFRLEAEAVRDVNLAVSGLLNSKVGGPSIKPPLPPDLAALSYAGGLKWTESPLAEQYRRGMYIHFQRTVPFPMLITFDAPESNVACTRRERSNTPLQALTLLNDHTAVECARGLGRRLSVQTGGVPDQIRYGFELAIGRPPEPAEMARLQQFCDLQTRAFRDDPEAARQLLGGKYDGDPVVPAALVAVSRVLLNLDELITRP